MSTQQEISRLQEQAQELVNNLAGLYKEVGSYQGAKDELGKVSSQILGLVEKTKQLSEESHQIIKATNQIGSAEIIKKLKKAQIVIYVVFGLVGVSLILQIVLFLKH